MSISPRIKSIWLKKILRRWKQNNKLTEEGKKIKKHLSEDLWSFDVSFDALKQYTRCGKYIQNCFDSNDFELTHTGRLMKRFINKHIEVLKSGSRSLMNFLLQRSDEDLKMLFGRRFLNVRKAKRKISGYNVFIKMYGFENIETWNTMDNAEKEKYNEMADEYSTLPTPNESKHLKKNSNSWTQAIQKWNESRESKTFLPITVGSDAYHEIKNIQKNLKK